MHAPTLICLLYTYQNIHIAYIHTHKCMHLYIYKCVICVLMYINTNIYAHACLPMYMYIYMHMNINMNVWMHICNVHLCMHINTYKHVCLHTYMHKYMHWIYIHIQAHLFFSIHLPTCIHSYSICKYPYIQACIHTCYSYVM